MLGVMYTFNRCMNFLLTKIFLDDSKSRTKFPYRAWLLTTCRMSSMNLSEVRDQGSESPELGGYVNWFILNCDIILVSVYFFNESLCISYYISELPGTR